MGWLSQWLTFDCRRKPLLAWCIFAPGMLYQVLNWLVVASSQR
jgi:hypothetical protein